ncbi:MAG TPA: tetratricopeptide repeat protein, partial [Pyrinomonadaceae bacterium]|nr:tetratricopeptide repeat protein [Pyrinomonadaceae bacterium]
MKAFALCLLVATSALVASAQDLQTNADDSPCPHPHATVSFANRVAPDREAYLRLVAELRKTFGQKLDAETRMTLDRTLEPATRDGYGSDLGAAFLLSQSGAAAVYAITWSATRDPNDALTANNLAVALKGLRDYDRALQVFLYAERLSPDNPLTLTNLAWLRIVLGDGSGAQSLFERALKKNSQDAVALAGLGLLAQCRGDRRSAEKYARESLKQRFLPIAAGVVNAAEDTSDDSSDSRPSQPNGANAPQSSSASSPGAGAEPFQNPRGKQSGQGFELPDPPFDNKVSDVVAGLEQIRSHNAKGADEAEQTAKQINDLAPALSSKSS